MLAAPAGHVLSDDDHACLRLINAEVVQAGAEALILLPGAPDAHSLLAWARRTGLRTFDWREAGAVDPRQV